MDDLDFDSILANIFLAVRTRLTTLPELKFIDQDLGQLELDEGDMNPVKFPCALADLVEIRYTDNSRNSQQGEGILELRLGVAAYAAATHYYTKNSHTENALAYYNLEHRVNKVLHGWSDDRFFNPLNRRSARTERRKDNVRVRVMAYAFGFVDNTAKEVRHSTARPDQEVDVAA